MKKILAQIIIALFIVTFTTEHSFAQTTYCVTGAGDASYNGEYTGTAGEFTLSGSTRKLFLDSFNFNKYTLAPMVTSDSAQYLYHTQDTGVGPEGVTWIVLNGTAPAPSVALGSCATPTPTPTLTFTPTLTLTPTFTNTAVPTSTITVVQTATSTPSATNTPLAIGTLRAVCVSKGLLKPTTYKLTEIDNDSNLYRFADGSDNFTIYSQAIGLLYINFDAYEQISSVPLPGLYEYKENTCCGKTSATASVTSGECASETAVQNIEEIVRSSISGKVNITRSSNNDIPALKPGEIYALLFSGEGPPTSGAYPLQGIIVDDDGTYIFNDVDPGDYNIVFKGAEIVFNPEFVNVSLVGSNGAKASDTSSTVKVFNDTGCKSTSLTIPIFELNQQIDEYEKFIKGQIINYNQGIAFNKLKGVKLTNTIKFIQDVSDSIDKTKSEIVAVANTYPLVNRSSCPAENSCTKETFAAKIKSINTALKSYNKALSKLSKKSIAIDGNAKNIRKNAALNKKASKMNEKIAKAFKQKLPAENQVCPEK